LAVITEGIHFLPVLAQAFPPSPSSTTGKRKRLDRWAQRATPVTPSKSARLLTDSLQSNQTELGTSPPPQELNETIIREYDNTSPIASPDFANETHHLRSSIRQRLNDVPSESRKPPMPIFSPNQTLRSVCILSSYWPSSYSLPHPYRLHHLRFPTHPYGAYLMPAHL
jgi:hypothetical protein